MNGKQEGIDQVRMVWSRQLGRTNEDCEIQGGELPCYLSPWPVGEPKRTKMSGMWRYYQQRFGALPTMQRQDSDARAVEYVDLGFIPVFPGSRGGFTAHLLQIWWIKCIYRWSGNIEVQ